ncbi:MAG: HEAT repeat domain-containing protein [Candidatus Brocadiales bacterium]
MLIAANGGVLEEAPENTFYAFELAVEQGATILKVDVRKSKDGKLVIMRDETIDRTTNGKGLVGELLYDEIGVYDAGSWLDKRFEGEPVPLLREVLRFAKINGLKVILDVKEQGLESSILALVEGLEMMKKVYFWGVLSNLREVEPSLVGPDLVFLSPEELTPFNIKQAHTQFKDVMTPLLNCDDREKMKQVIMKGPDIILVDFPALASDVLNVKGRRRAIRRIQKRRPLVTMPFEGRTGRKGKEDEFFADEQGGVIDLLDPVGSLYHLLLGRVEEGYREGSEKSSRRASLRREVSSLSRELYEPSVSEKGFFGQAISKIRRGMSDEEADESRVAALKMTSLPPPAVVPRLVKALSSRRPVVRGNAAWALGLIGDYSVLPELAELLDDEDEAVDVRRDAAIALGRLRHSAAVKLLQKRLVGDQVPPIRYDAARALGEIGDPGIIGDLIRVMEGGADWRIKGACAGALGKIGDPGAVTKLGEFLMKNTGAPYSIWARSQAAWALSAIGEDSLGVLLAALRDDEKFVRRKSAWAMARIGRPAIPALVRALRDPDGRVRERAALALGWIGDSKAILSLVRSIYDEELKVRRAVVWAIGHIGGARAEKALGKLLSADEDEKIKEIAGEAIARLSKR